MFSIAPLLLLVIISAQSSFKYGYVIIFPDLLIVRVGFYPALFPKEDGRVPAWVFAVLMLALEAKAAPPIFVVDPPSLDVAQDLCKPLTFPEIGFSSAASSGSLCDSLCNCCWHSLAPLLVRIN